MFQVSSFKIMDLDSQIEAILFINGEPISIKRLSDLTEHSEEEINKAITALEQKLSGRGIRLLRKDNEVMLGTAPEISDLTEKLIKDEFSGELTKAALEVLTIVVYKGPVTRSEIDYIRGVNSSFTLRNLLIRGLIERVPNPKDQRSYLYTYSFKLLQYLGIEQVNKLPEYDLFRKAIEESKNYD